MAIRQQSYDNYVLKEKQLIIQQTNLGELAKCFKS